MPVKNLRAARTRLLGRFIGAEEGVSAVEFALLTPVLMALFCGSIDLSRIVTAANRATFVADTVAELVSQVNHTLTADEITAFMTSGVLIDPDILAYQRQSGVSADLAANVTVSSVAFAQKIPSCTANCEYEASVVFSKRNNTAGAARACGKLTSAADSADPSVTTLPASLHGPVPLVVVDVDIFIKPLFTFLFTNDMKFSRSAYFRPRVVDRVNSFFNCTEYVVTS